MRSGLLALLRNHEVTATDLGDELLEIHELAASVIVARNHREAQQAATLISTSNCPVICLVQDDEPDLAIALLRAGANAVLPFDSDSGSVIAAVTVSLQGLSVVSRSTSAYLVALAEPKTILTESEITWLQLLASGATVAQIAVLANYSERTLYRLLAQCYRRLGVDGRTEAIELAVGLGILIDDAPRDPQPESSASFRDVSIMF